MTQLLRPDPKTTARVYERLHRQGSDPLPDRSYDPHKIELIRDKLRKIFIDLLDSIGGEAVKGRHDADGKVVFLGADAIRASILPAGDQDTWPMFISSKVQDASYFMSSLTEACRYRDWIREMIAKKEKEQPSADIGHFRGNEHRPDGSSFVCVHTQCRPSSWPLWERCPVLSQAWA